MVASAHDFWLEPAGDGLVLRYGHRGAELRAIEPGRVKSARCLDAAHDLLPAAVFAGTEVRLPARCAAASAALDAGYYSLTPDGEVNLPRSQAKDAVRSWASRQFAKWVDVRSPHARAVLGDELELVLASPLANARVGDKVTVRVLHLGRPVEGAVVAIDHVPLGETDSAGAARVRIRRRVETIGATLRRRIATPEAEHEVLEASVSFEVRP